MSQIGSEGSEIAGLPADFENTAGGAVVCEMNLAC